jgi:hypothetical protein
LGGAGFEFLFQTQDLADDYRSFPQYLQVNIEILPIPAHDSLHPSNINSTLACQPEVPLSVV